MDKRDMNNLASTKLAGVGFGSWGLYQIAIAQTEVAVECVFGIVLLGLGMIVSETLKKK